MPADLDPAVWTDADGTTFTLRRIGPDDVERSRVFLASLSFGTRYFRFGRGDFAYDDAELARICTPDPARREHLIVTVDDGDARPMAASARYAVADDGQEGEFAIVVLDRWQHHGLGRRLMSVLLGCARRRGLARLHGHILGTNRRMLAFVERLGFVVDPATRDQAIRSVSIDLGAPAQACRESAAAATPPGGSRPRA
jgi:GNAT superfamily N-acetyltransferase